MTTPRIPESVADIENQEHEDSASAERVMLVDPAGNHIYTEDGKLKVDATINIPAVTVDSAKTGSPDGGTTKVFLKTNAGGEQIVVLPDGASTEETLEAFKAAFLSVITAGVVNASDAETLAEIEKLTALIASAHLKTHDTDVLAKLTAGIDVLSLPSGLATTAGQSAIIDAIEALVIPTGVATEVTLAALKSVIDGLVVDGKLAVTTPDVSGLALEAGGNLAAIKAKTDNIPSDPAKESGKLTDIELHTKAVSDAIAGTGVPVSGPLTDAQIRATALPVSGPLTDAQIRASALPVSVATLPSHEVTNAGTFPVQEASAADIETNTGNIDANIGAKADDEATTNIGTFSLIALVKRLINTTLALLNVQGKVADDAASTANPVIIGGVAVDMDGTDPTAVSAEGDVAFLRLTKDRRLLVSRAHPRGTTYYADFSAAQTDTQLVAAPASGLSIYVTDIVISNGATAGTVIIEEDTASAKTAKFKLYPGINGGCALHFNQPIKLTAEKNLGVLSATVTTHSVLIGYFIA
jgi:hypothetical protein